MQRQPSQDPSTILGMVRRVMRRPRLHPEKPAPRKIRVLYSMEHKPPRRSPTTRSFAADVTAAYFWPKREPRHNRIRTQPSAAPQSMDWSVRLENILAPIPLDAAACGAGLSWTWS